MIVCDKLLLLSYLWQTRDVADIQVLYNQEYLNLMFYYYNYVQGE